MKKVLVLFALFSTMLLRNSYAQSVQNQLVASEVKMNYVFSYEEALKKAKDENKPIFFNCFADWAGPCHAMDKHVFSNKDFAKWMDKHFINLFIDVTTPEGRPFAEKYHISFMAHYLVLDSSGQIIHRIVGGSKIPEFQRQLKQALNPETSLRGMNFRYDHGERSPIFLREYLRTLLIADEGTKADSLQDYYIRLISKKDIAQKENWFIFKRLIKDIDNEWFDLLIQDKAIFVKENGLEQVNDLISNTIIRESFPYILGSKTADSAFVNSMQQLMNVTQLPLNSECRDYFKIVEFRSAKKYIELIAYLEQFTETIQTEIASNIDLSLLKISDLSIHEKNSLCSYLTKRSSKLSGTTKNMYDEAIRGVKNEDGIKFIDVSFADALSKAKAKQKFIFIDCYTGWCGPCSMMSKKVFTQKEVGDFFNGQFINLKIDMDTPEGKELGKRYNVTSYPTLLLITDSGEVAYKLIGALPGYELIRKIKRGLSQETAYHSLYNLHAKQEINSPMLFTNYLLTMKDAGDIANPNELAQTYFCNLSLENKLDSTTWPLLQNFATSSKDSFIDFMLKNRTQYIKNINKRDFDWKLESVLCREMLSYLQEQKTFDANLDHIMKKVDDANLPDDHALSYWVAIFKTIQQKKYTDLMQLYTDKISLLQDAREKLNLDILWLYFLSNMDKEGQQSVLSYLKESGKRADSRAVNKYKELILECENRI